MTLAARGVVGTHRPFPVVFIMSLLAVLGIGAIGGGLAMIFGVGGESMMPDEYLEALPLVDNWVVPGLVLLIVFGFGSLILLYGVWRRPRWSWLDWLERATGHHWSWFGTILLGVGHMIWITLELVSIPLSILMPIFGAVGLALALLPFLTSVKEYLAT
jgi:hypothetical protein